MDPSDEVSRSLILWLDTLVPCKTKPTAEICNGVVLCQALVQICPEHFNKLLPKIKPDVANNWRLKVSNLKKINEAVMEYLQDVTNLHVPDVARPDLLRLGETNDLIQLGKLLRLMLVCAVNCDKKQEYITHIMALEEVIQQCIMLAIQQLEDVTGGAGRTGLSLLSMDSDSRVQRLVSDLESVTEAKEALAQQCHVLESQVTSLQEERQVLLSDYKNLEKQIKEQSQPDSNRSPENRRQIDLLKEEMFKLETVRDDYRAKLMEQERHFVALQEKLTDLQQAAEANARLKDEVDALTESANKVETLEKALAQYKKKLEDYTDVKRQLKVLEDKNVEYLQQNMHYEEELKKSSQLKNQSEMYKNRYMELQQKLDEEVQKSDKMTFLKNNLDTRLNVLQTEKERVQRERDLLRDENEELRCNGNSKQTVDAVDRQLTSTEMRERLTFLEAENTSLRNVRHERDAKQEVIDDQASRLERLSEQQRSSNQRVAMLEAQLEEMQLQKSSGKMTDDTDGGKDCNSNNSNMSQRLKEYKQTIQSLQEMLSSKDAEINDLQAKHTRYLQKANEVALSLEAVKLDGVCSNSNSGSMVDLDHHHQLVGGRGSSSSTEGAANSTTGVGQSSSGPTAQLGGNFLNNHPQLGHHLQVKEKESQLMASAFYRMSLMCHREAVDERLALLSAGQAQTCLARQRQPVPRKQPAPFRSK